MAFQLFTPPCFAAIGAMKTELGSTKLTLLAVLFQLAVGYVISMVIYQLGTLIFYQQLGQGFIVSLIMFLMIIITFVAIKIRRVRVSHG